MAGRESHRHGIGVEREGLANHVAHGHRFARIRAATRHLPEDDPRHRVELPRLTELGEHPVDTIGLLVHIFQEEQANEPAHK